MFRGKWHFPISQFSSGRREISTTVTGKVRGGKRIGVTKMYLRGECEFWNGRNRE